jgi:hypothetical protein
VTTRSSSSVSVHLLSLLLSYALVAAAPLHVQFPPGREGNWVLLAADGAVRRLSDPQCQALLSDFSDADGHTLAEGLSAQGHTLLQHLREVWLLSGSGQGACGKSKTDAFTVPTGRLVFLCPELFRQEVSKYHELLIIHELLHTLGLGENPPSSASITRQVAKRCGSL